MFARFNSMLGVQKCIKNISIFFDHELICACSSDCYKNMLLRSIIFVLFLYLYHFFFFF